MADAKRGKMHASASQLALVLLLIGWKGGANLLSQSHRVESAKPITFRHSNENRSNMNLRLLIKVKLIARTYISSKVYVIWICFQHFFSVFYSGIIQLTFPRDFVEVVTDTVWFHVAQSPAGSFTGDVNSTNHVIFEALSINSVVKL